MEWQMHAQGRPAQEVIEAHTQQSACCVLGTTIQARQVSDAEVIRAEKAQAGVAGGFRFLNDPVCFVSSLLVKKPRRLQGVLLVMTLALLVYSLTQRRWRPPRADRHDTIAHHIHQPTERPTLRGVFQLLEGIHRVQAMVQGQGHDLIDGLNEVQINILRLFGDEVGRLYQISPE
jgi:transposase